MKNRLLMILSVILMYTSVVAVKATENNPTYFVTALNFLLR